MNHHTIIEVPAGKQFFTIEELPHLFADSVPEPADTVEGNWAVRLVMAQSEFGPLIEAAAIDGSLPVLDPFTRLPARYPSGFNTKRLQVTLDAFRDFASKHGFDVREKAEPPQVQEAPEVQEQPEQAEREDTWQEQARKIADECYKHDAAMGVLDVLAKKDKKGDVAGGYAYRVMEIMQERKIHAPRGRITNAATIAKELQGKKWWGNKVK
jgi:hypothetical protein